MMTFASGKAKAKKRKPFRVGLEEAGKSRLKWWLEISNCSASLSPDLSSQIASVIMPRLGSIGTNLNTIRQKTLQGTSMTRGKNLQKLQQ